MYRDACSAIRDIFEHKLMMTQETSKPNFAVPYKRGVATDIPFHNTTPYVSLKDFLAQAADAKLKYDDLLAQLRIFLPEAVAHD